MLIEEYIINVYCLVDEMLKKVVKNSVRQRGPVPKLSDAEVVAMEIVGESLGFDQDKKIHGYFKNHWPHYFPGIGHRATFLRQAANLWRCKQKIREELVGVLLPSGSGISIIDGFPMPVCGFKRAYFSRLHKGDASYGHCAAKGMKYYGFKGHLLIDKSGVIIDLAIAAANVDEREMLLELAAKNGVKTLGDKGYICSERLKDELTRAGVNLHTPLRDNMKDDRPKEVVKALNNTRRIVETVIGQLSERFKIEKVRARDLWHLTVRAGRKLLAHTVDCYLNHIAGNPILQFDKLLT
jgi:hypothetical protein